MSNYANLIELYKDFLSSPRLDWQNQIRKPVKTNILRAMSKVQRDIGEDPTDLINQTINEGGKLLFWSDQHFFHHNIIRYASRPFNDMNHMSQIMLKNYWANVTEKDIVIFGGDVGFGDVEEIKKFLRILPGKKILVLGNHDFEKNNLKYRDYKVFDKVTMCFPLVYKHQEKEFIIYVSHYPIDNKYLINNINIHGHIHQYNIGGKHINMAVEQTNYAPIELKENIEKSIELLFV